MNFYAGGKVNYIRLLFVDFQQIELRLLAHLSNDPDLLRLFTQNNDQDVFTQLTAQW